MLNDWFGFPSSMNWSDEEKAANRERIDRAADRVREVSPPERCDVCGRRSCDDDHVYDDVFMEVVDDG